MDQIHWNNSFLKKRWFREEDSLPPNAVEEISRRTLLHYQRVAGVAESISNSLWHTHPVRSDAWSRDCSTCQAFMQLFQNLQRLFADMDGIVMDFFDEPEHHRELEMAVRLYSFSLLFVVPRFTPLEKHDLLEYALYRIEELHGLSIVRKDLHNTSTSDAEIQFLVQVFVEVYKGLWGELNDWKQKNPHLPLQAFPALSATALLHKQSTGEWPSSPSSCG